MPLPPGQAIFPLTIAGGLATEYGPRAPTTLDNDGRVVVPYLLFADNAAWSFDGWPKKMPGATRVNTTTTGATDAVMGIFDHWRQGTAGTQVQKRVIYAGTAIYKDDADGVWDSLATGLEANMMPWAAGMNDVLVLASTSNTDVPQRYNQTNIANLGGTPPNFAFHVEHKDRMFAAGVVANPSRLYYTALGLHEDWVGTGSGSIDIFSDDGDRITGLWSMKDELLIFKGPNHGSIYRLIGSSPTGAQAFQLVPFLRGVGCTSQQSIVAMREDLLWWDQNGIHSLRATAAFGDYALGFVSAPIASLFRDELNHSRFGFVWGQAFVAEGYVLWTVSQTGATTNNLVLMLDFRFTPPRFSRWPAYQMASIGMVLDGTRGRIPWFGSYTGFVCRGNSTTPTVNTLAYTTRVQFPYLSFGDPFYDKGVLHGRIAFRPKADTDFTVSYRRDENVLQTATIAQAGTVITLGDAAAPVAATDFMLDVDLLDSSLLRHEFFDMEGTFKDLQLELGDVVSAFEPHDLAILVEQRGMAFVTPPG